MKKDARKNAALNLRDKPGLVISIEKIDKRGEHPEGERPVFDTHDDMPDFQQALIKMHQKLGGELMDEQEQIVDNIQSMMRDLHSGRMSEHELDRFLSKAEEIIESEHELDRFLSKAEEIIDILEEADPECLKYFGFLDVMVKEGLEIADEEADDSHARRVEEIDEATPEYDEEMAYSEEEVEEED